MEFDKIILKFLDYILKLRNPGQKYYIILKHSIAFLIFFVIKNETNQEILNQNKDFSKLIQTMLAVDYKSMQKYVLFLLCQIYKDCYPILLNLTKEMNEEIVKKLGKKFEHFAQKKNNKEFCVYFFQILPFLFKTHSKSLPQNKIWIIKQISSNQINLIYPIKKLTEECLSFKIEKCLVGNNIGRLKKIMKLKN